MTNTTNSPRVNRAIRDSILRTEVVRVDLGPTELSDLLNVADDHTRVSTDDGPEYEAWGTDDDGDEWRVHARPDGN